MQIFMEIIISLIYFILALLVPSCFKNFNNEITRKLSHIICGSWIFIFAFFNNYLLSNIIIIVFMIILMCLSYKFKIFKGVERKNQIKSYGTIYFFLALLILVLISEKTQFNKLNIIIYFLPLIYGDAMAAIIGKKFVWIKYTLFGNTKTVSGSIAMFITSFISIILYNTIILNHMYSMQYILLISTIASIIEAVSIKGLDNFSIPIVTMYVMEVLL